MRQVQNVSTGPRGAYLKGTYVEANPGEVIEADDFAEEWFDKVAAKKPAKPEPAEAEREA